MSMKPLSIRVWGDFACFTRPEMKVERVSYEFMTPSAARGVLEAIFWKPQFDWVVERIDVLKPVRFSSVLRNEVKDKIAFRTVQKWPEDGGHYDVTDRRTQRHALVLRDVAYNIHASMRLRPGVNDNPAKYRDQFQRRVRKGQCFWRPYLGCREFSAYFSPVDPGELAFPMDMAIGRMLFDLKYDDRIKKKTFGQGTPVFFDARLTQGTLEVPTSLYDELLSDKVNR